MTLSRRIVAALAACCLDGLAGAALAEGDSRLEPYQMVRSLQLVQDRIAAGDQAALPMQRKLLELIDERFTGTNSPDFVDERNYEALLVYAMSGGNPATIARLLARLHLTETDRALGTGILDYLNGNMAAARAALDPVDPMQLSPELGAFFALVKGSIIAPDDPHGAVKMFDEARLLSPGTLVEEAALRRSILLDTHNLDARHFLLVSSQYVRRFLLSPYASQFADGFVGAVMALHKTIQLAEVEDIIAGMDPERQKVIYLRLARRAAIEGVPDLAEYASAKADAIEIHGTGSDSDPRTLLYSSLAAITSDTIDQILPKLGTIDRSRLSENDRKLLDAAQAIATEVTAAPISGPAAAEPAVAQPSTAVDVAAEDSADDGLPEAEPLDGPLPTAPDAPAALSGRAEETEHSGTGADLASADEGAPEPAPAEPAHEAAHAAPTDVASAVDAADPTDAMLADARKKLDEIDTLLGDTTK